MIYMRGVKSENLTAMVDFFYHGEANVFQENLDSFLALAEEFQLKGLRGNETEKEPEVFPLPAKRKDVPKLLTPKKAPKHDPEGLMTKDEPIETSVALTDQTTNNTYIDILDQQVKSMMIFSDNAAPYKNGRARICKVCGKEGTMQSIMSHIEANHITEISIPCDLCEKSFKSRNVLATHKYRQHRKNQ